MVKVVYGVFTTGYPSCGLYLPLVRVVDQLKTFQTVICKGLGPLSSSLYQNEYLPFLVDFQKLSDRLNIIVRVDINGLKNIAKIICNESKKI